MESIIRDINLAESGERKIEWVKRNCDLLRTLEKEFSQTKPFAGKKVALSVHLEAKTAYLCKVLAAGVPADMKDGEIEISLYDQIWQAGAILLSDVKSVGVMGDERTYENPVALRAVTSADAMTADWAKLPYEFLAEVSNQIIRNVKGVNRVCYDVSSKPPATIEWE